MSSNKTLSAIVANKIENQIICGNWQVGSQIPPEQELMQVFDVSRITVREAIKTLVSRDVLEIRRGCGTFVSAVPGLSTDPLGLRFIADDDLNTHLFEARQVLEPTVCRLAALRGDEEELALLKQLAQDIDDLDAQLQGKKTTPEVIQAIAAKDIAFHTFLCRMSKNPVFERMLPVIIKSVRASYSLLVPRLSNSPRVSIHGEIYKAVAAHDGDEAYRLMLVHLDNSRKGFDRKTEKEAARRSGKTKESAPSEV